MPIFKAIENATQVDINILWLYGNVYAEFPIEKSADGREVFVNFNAEPTIFYKD